MKILLYILIAGCMVASGCSTTVKAPKPHVQQYSNKTVRHSAGSAMLTSSLYAADQLLANAAVRLPMKGAVIASSLVELESLTDTTSFGRLTANQIGSRLAEHGYDVVEARLREYMGMRTRKGEFMLSRETAKLVQQQYDAVGALTGTYLATEAEVFVSVRLIRLADGAVVGAYEYVLPNKGAVARLLDPDRTRRVWGAYVGRQRVDNVVGDGPSSTITSTSVPVRVEPAPQGSKVPAMSPVVTREGGEVVPR